MRLACMVGSVLLALTSACTQPAQPAPPTPAPAPRAPAPAAVAVGTQPKPGERVRQPLLDDHCGDITAPVAFYYHGGRPFAQRALGDGCRPLYITECDESGDCSQANEQEQGMWCCEDPTATAAHAERR